MVFKRGGALVGRLRRGFGRGVHLVSLHGRVLIQLCAQGFGGLPVLRVVKRISSHKVTWTGATSATAVRGEMRVQASDADVWQGARCALCRDRRGSQKKSGGHIEAYQFIT